MNPLRLVIIVGGIALVVSLFDRLVGATQRAETGVDWSEAILLGVSYTIFVVLSVARMVEQIRQPIEYIHWVVLLAIVTGLGALIHRRLFR